MDELMSSQSPSENSIDSFENLRLSGNQFYELQPYDPNTIQELPDIFFPEKSLTESVKQTYKMCSSTIKTLKTNLAYNIRHSTFDVFTKREKVILNKQQPITLLGKVYQNHSKDKERFLTDFNNVIWLTYRSGIYGVQSDAGWGCMIRVCQMVLAQTFKRVTPEIPLKKIIDYFRDTPQAYFSLTRICQKGDIKERWTSSIQIFTLLKNLMLKFKEIPLSIDLHSCSLQFKNLQELDYVQYPLLLFVSNRLGKTKLELQFKDHILQLMKIPHCVGIIGGNGGEALYLIGHYCKKLIFMDPHYVQQYEEDQKHKDTSTYFQSQPYAIDVECLAPSIAFNFLVQSKKQYQNLLTQLYQIQSKYYPWVSFEINSQYLKKTMQPQVHQDDFFEIIL